MSGEQCLRTLNRMNELKLLQFPYSHPYYLKWIESWTFIGDFKKECQGDVFF